MAKRREKGKIPHSEWPAIRLRYAAGESLASIARDYECTGPAIRYIVNRPDAAGGAAPVPVPVSLEAGDAAEPGWRPVAADIRADVGRGDAGRSDTPTALRELLGGQSDARVDAAGIDPDLRWRVSSEIASFLAVFDSFLTDNSPESYDQLLGATDRLMRVAARIRIELERARTSEHTRLRQAGGIGSRAIAS